MLRGALGEQEDDMAIYLDADPTLRQDVMGAIALALFFLAVFFLVSL